MKKVLSLMICLAVTAGMLIAPPAVQAEEPAAWDGTAVDYSWYDGQESPYTISTPAQFAAFANIVNQKNEKNDRFAGKTVNLAADLDMGKMPFCAIGGSAMDSATKAHNAFAGTFEGNGHIIKNLNITQSVSANCAALFACVRGATMRNLGLENVTVKIEQNGVTYQGAFVGYVMGDTPSTIENCFVRDVNINVTTPIDGGRIGGFAGFVTPWNVSHVVKNCYSLNVRFSETGTGTVGYGFGHFAGLTESNATFINCYSGGVPKKPGDVYSNSGKVLPFGMIKGTIVTNCYSDCYPDESNLSWFLTSTPSGGGFNRGGTDVSTADLKGMTGAVALGTGFVKAENDIYNYGYPFLKWEEKYVEDIRQSQPTGTFEIVNHEQTEDQLYNVTVSNLGADVEYRYAAYGKPGAWQDSNEFTNLPTGKYTFEARTKGNAAKYPSKEITTEEITFKLSSVWNGTAVDYSWYDDHTSPYTIETPEQFAAFGNILNHKGGYSDNFAGKTINLTDDLDMGNKSFSAMGGHVLGQEFAGTFEGKGHIIKNLNINKLGYDGSNCAALFACVRAATVSNLGLEGVTVEVPGTTAKYQAALVGYVLGNTPTTIENCFVRDVNINVTSSTTENNDYRIGGFAGFVSPWSANHVVKNCYSINVRFSQKNDGEVQYGFGHFAGLTEDKASFINCYSGGVPEKPADSTLPQKVLSFGMIKGTTVTNCYSDCYADDGKLSWNFTVGGFVRAGSKVSTPALKSTVDMGEGFMRTEGTGYNYGYPFLKWEEPRAEVVEGSITMHRVTDSLSGEAGENITPAAFSDTYDTEANSTFDLVFDQGVDLSTVTKEAVTFNDTAADAVTTDSANTRRVRVNLSSALTPLTRGRLKVCGVKNSDGKYLKNMEICFTTAGAGVTGDHPVISSFELVENYATPNETPVPQEADPAGKTITAVAGGLYNNTDSANSYTLMLARYNEKGVLEDVAMNAYELGAREYLSESGTSSTGSSAELKPTKVELTVPADSKGHTVKAFAWETKSMKPLWESFEVCKPIKLLIIGNSITKHSPNPDIGWEHDWGMAATAESKDYVHQLAAKAKTVGPVDLMMVNSYDFEMYFYDFTKFDTGKYQKYIDFEPDIIICTIGANIKNPEPEGNDGVLTDIHFNKDYYKNIIDFFNKSGKAKVIVGTTIFTPEGGEVQTAIKAYADENSIPYVKMNDMEDEKYSAKPYRDQFPANVSDGVLLHPGDAGMAEMANRLWVNLQPVMKQCLAER